MATVSEIRAALKVRLDTISGLRTYAEMPASPEFPAAGIAMRSIAYDQDLDGGVLYGFVVWLHVSAGRDLQRAQKALDVYLAPTGATSIKAAIEADPDLGGTCDWVRVTGATEGPRLVPEAGGQPWAMPIDVQVMSS